MSNPDCPYCDGQLREMDKREHILQCSNVGGCPATFVAVIE